MIKISRTNRMCILLLCVLLLLPLLGGCGGKGKTVYRGQGEYWQASCTLDENGHKKSYAIRYSAEGRAPAGQVDYRFVSSENFQERGQFDGKGARTLHMDGKSTLTTSVAEEESFELLMTWNGQEERITMKKEP